MSESSERPVVTVFLRHRGNVLLLRRSDDVGSYPGQWGAVAGHLDRETPLASALEEIEEETGLSEKEVTMVQEGTPFSVEDDDGRQWKVHPFLFDTNTRSIRTNWETADTEWTSPTVLLRRDTVPDLWTSYRRVAPSIVGITNDTTHGSSYLSIRALELVRDRAGMLATSDASTIDDARSRLIGTVHRVLDARPAMAAVTNRIHRVMHASLPELAPSAIETAAHETITEAFAADAEAAAHAADQIAGDRVLTLSRSGTVLAALKTADPSPVVTVATSNPGGEGVAVAEELADEGLDVTLIPDTAATRCVADDRIERVLVGADTVLPSGDVSNKVGTRGLALAAAAANVPVSVVCATDKISVDEDSTDESAPSREVYDGPKEVDVWAPRFDTTPAALVTGEYLTERGALSSEDVSSIANELEHLRSWT